MNKLNDNLLQKLWNEFYKEEDKWEQLFMGTSNQENWFTSYRHWLQAGFEIAIRVIAAHEEGGEMEWD